MGGPFPKVVTVPVNTNRLGFAGVLINRIAKRSTTTQDDNVIPADAQMPGQQRANEAAAAGQNDSFDFHCRDLNS
jgi:hypothetical protein